jgi:hypothetical protein
MYILFMKVFTLKWHTFCAIFSFSGNIMTRPLATVYNEDSKVTDAQIKLPAVCRASIRTGVVSFIHDQVRRPQAHAVCTLVSVLLRTVDNMLGWNLL